MKYRVQLKLIHKHQTYMMIINLIISFMIKVIALFYKIHSINKIKFSLINNLLSKLKINFHKILF